MKTTTPPPTIGGGLDDFLVDVSGSGTSDVHATTASLTPGAEEGYKRFVCKNSGVLFENQTLQIGIKSEFKKNLGRYGIFFGNKSTSILNNFTVDLTLSPALEESLKIQKKPIPNIIAAGAQTQEIINVECINVFQEPPLIDIKFHVGGTPQNIILKLPLMLHKFAEPATMAGSDFFQRWKQLSNAQEAQKIFIAKNPIEKESIESKLTACGFSTLKDVDPNADNFVSACIINTTNVLVGVLLRLEPNYQTQQYRLTLRTSHETISKNMAELLSEQF